MEHSIYRKQKVADLKNKAFTLYKEGLSTREIAKVVNRSHQWVAVAIREKLSTA